MLRLCLLAAMTMFLACAPASRPVAQSAPSGDQMSSDVLSKSDPAVDTSKNPSTSHGGCGSWFIPCPDVNKFNPSLGEVPDAHPFGCVFCSAGHGLSSPWGALVVLLVPLLLRRRRAV